MSINKKIFLLFFFLFFFSCILFITILKDRESSSIDFENSIIKNKIISLDKIFKDRLSSLNTISYEYSFDKNILTLLENKKINLNIYEDIASRLKVSYFIILNNNNKIIFSQAYDISSNEYVDIPDEIISLFNKNNIKKFIDNKDKLNFMTLNFEKSLFSIERVDNLGFIFVARNLDSAFLLDTSLLLDSYVTLKPSYSFKNRNIFTDFSFMYDINREKDFIFSNVKFKDSLDNSEFYLNLKINRSFYNEIMQSNKLLLSLFFILFLVFNLLIYLFMNKVFTKRIGKIALAVKDISKNKEIGNKIIDLSYNDEITYLSKKMNEMFRVINNDQNEKLKKERDFLQSVLDSQQHIIFITDGKDIKSSNKRFLDIFKTNNSFLDNIALLDDNTKYNLIKVAEKYSSIDNPAKFKIDENKYKYFVFNISKVELEKYIVCMNDVSKFNEKIIHLKTKASTDELTGCFNKTTIIEYCKYWMKVKGFGFIVLDIDKFKDVNDTYGHIVGDSILKELAKIISLHLHKNDMLGRFGGEEFIILIDDMSNNIENISNRIREVIQNHIFVYKNLRLKITVSLGCTYYKEDSSYEELFHIADTGLYEAKNTGRNKVVYKDSLS